MTIEEIRALVARATTSDERLLHPGLPSTAGHKNRLLSTQGRNVGDAGLFFAAQDRPSESALPNWSKRLRAILAAVRQGPPAAIPVSEPVPFADLLLPVVARAQRQLAKLTGPHDHELLSLQAQNDLSRSLLHRLSAVTSAALLREFDLFRHFARASTRFFTGDDDSCVLYDEFVTEMRGRLAELIAENPVLGRMIGTVVDSWLRATGELIRALADDGPALCALFAGGRELGPVVAITCDLSDPHRGGRTVAILEFACRTKLVYKPKDLELDRRWGDFLDWLQAAGAPLDLHSARVLPRKRHGWAEFIAAEATDAAPPPSYYRRAGALLALLYLFQARDIHSGNVLRRGNQSILIDLETLFHPTPVAALRDWPSDAATAAALERLSDSVAATLYLPLWVAPPTGEPIALGGLSGVAPGDTEAPAFHHINTDAMRAAGRPAHKPKTAENHGDQVALARPENLAALCVGFVGIYRFFQDSADMLAAEDGPIARHFAGVTIRAVFKPTSEYLRKLRLATRQVSHLNSAAAWSAQFHDPHETAISAAERRSLANLDVPLFGAVTDGLALEADGETIAGCFTATPLAQVLARVRRLGTADLDFQLSLVKASLRLGADPPCPVWLQAAHAWGGADFPARAIAACRDIARTLDRSAIRSGDGAAWLGIVPVDHDHEAVSVIGTDLYSGSIGVALFLAAFARTADDRPARELALAAVASVMRIHGSAGASARMPIGAGFGIASVIYGLVQLADLLGRPDLLDHAIGLSREIGAERIAADRSHDLLRGAGGAILGLLALHGVRPEPDLLERAIWCGEHLLTALPARQHETGAAFALARLWQTSGQQRFADAARATWPRAPELATSSEPGCSGLVGHGQTAVGLLQSGVAPDLRPELESAIATAAGDTAFDDSLCCGRSGGIELLIMAGRTLGRPDLLALAQRTAAAHLLPGSTHHHSFRPGLFRGLSGVGYTLLRSIHPGRLPSPLLWDGPPASARVKHQ